MSETATICEYNENYFDNLWNK